MNEPKPDGTRRRPTHVLSGQMTELLLKVCSSHLPPFTWSAGDLLPRPSAETFYRDLLQRPSTETSYRDLLQRPPAETFSGLVLWLRAVGRTSTNSVVITLP